MQELVKEGKLKDISIPNYFVIPEGYLNKAKEYLGEEDSESYWDKLFEGIYTQDIEGGIGRDGRIWFWQTRDIVAKSVKNI